MKLLEKLKSKINKKEYNPLYELVVLDRKIHMFDVCQTCNFPFYEYKMGTDACNVTKTDIVYKGEKLVQLTCKRCKTDYVFKNYGGN